MGLLYFVVVVVFLYASLGAFYGSILVYFDIFLLDIHCKFDLAVDIFWSVPLLYCMHAVYDCRIFVRRIRHAHNENVCVPGRSQWRQYATLRWLCEFYKHWKVLHKCHLLTFRKYDIHTLTPFLSSGELCIHRRSENNL